MVFTRYIFIAVFFLSCAQAMKRDANGQEVWLTKCSVRNKYIETLTLKSREKEVIITYDTFFGNLSGSVNYTCKNYRELLTRGQIDAYLKAAGFTVPRINLRNI